MDTRETMPEITDALSYHGGNLDVARRLFPDAPTPWIDLSTGINPVPYPIGAITPSAWTRLPEQANLAALEQTARIAYDAAPHAELIAAPGTQSVIQWLPRLLPARRVGILGFTYEEHARCWQETGAEIVRVDALSDFANVDVGICVNPNNPDGRIIPPDDLAASAESMAVRGGSLIVDEAFMDVLGNEASLAPRLPDRGALILRSFGKTYGLAGLRLGFALATPELGPKLRAALGPWPVSGPAIEIAGRALADGRWRAEAIALLRDKAGRLDNLLQAAGFEIVGGTPLFRLARHARSGVRFEHLGRAGILTRPFRQRPDWLRVGIPGPKTDWDRLEAAW